VISCELQPVLLTHRSLYSVEYHSSDGTTVTVPLRLTALTKHRALTHTAQSAEC
jgi:hypothetical protein